MEQGILVFGVVGPNSLWGPAGAYTAPQNCPTLALTGPNGPKMAPNARNKWQTLLWPMPAGSDAPLVGKDVRMERFR